MMEKCFHLTANRTTVRREVLAGLTTFLTMMYILFANSEILSEIGMPWQGVFVATALSAGISTILVALYANLPVAAAPAMGINTVFSYTLCMRMGYHWKEALAISFLAGVFTAVILSTPLRKAFVNAFPEYLRIAAGAGLGMFIAYVGIRNTGLLIFHAPAGQYQQMGNGIVVNGQSMVPGLVNEAAALQLVPVVGLAVMTVLRALEKKTGDRYAALPIGILVATFIGIPMNVTRMNGVIPLVGASMAEGFHQVFLSFFGSPGLLSIFTDPATSLRTWLMICVLGMTGILNSIGTMVGIGQVHDAKLFDEEDMKKFSRKGAGSKLDRALIANSIGKTLSPVFGTSATTIFLESVTGITAGGRTGLTGLVVGILFLLCLPLAGFFQIIPNEAVSPALIFAGVSMLTRLRGIDWQNFEEGFPAFLTILVMPLTYSILDGIAIGIISHVIIQFVMGKRRKLHPILFVVSAVYVIIKCGEHLI